MTSTPIFNGIPITITADAGDTGTATSNTSAGTIYGRIPTSGYYFTGGSYSTITNTDYDFRVEGTTTDLYIDTSRPHTTTDITFSNGGQSNASIQFNHLTGEFVLIHPDGTELSLTKMAKQIEELSESFKTVNKQLNTVLPVLTDVAELYARQASRLRITDDE